MARKRHLRSAMLVVCRRSGWHYWFPVILILLELTCEVLVSLLYLLSSKAEGAVLIFIWILPSWLVLYLLWGHYENIYIWLNLFGLGILREGFAQDCHSRGLFWARAIFDSYLRITPSAAVQIWAGWSFRYQDGSGLMSLILWQLVLAISVSISIFSVGYFTTESTLVFWKSDEMSWKMWLVLVFLFALDFFIRVAAFCLVLRWNLCIGLGVISIVFFTEYAIFRKRGRSIIFAVRLMFSHYPARPLGRSGELEFKSRIFVSAVLTIFTYICSSSVGLQAFLIYLFVVSIELLIYVLTIKQLRCQWEIENPPGTKWSDNENLQIQVIENKGYSQGSLANRSFQYFESLRSSDRETEKHDQNSQQDSLNQKGKIIKDYRGTKTSYIKPPQLIETSSESRRIFGCYANLETTMNPSPRAKLRSLGTPGRRDLKKFTGWKECRTPRSAEGTLAESWKGTQRLTLPQARLDTLKENTEVRSIYSLDDVGTKSATNERGETSLPRLKPIFSATNTYSISGLISAGDSFSDFLVSPSDRRFSFTFGNLTRRSSLASLPTSFSESKTNVFTEISEDECAPTVTQWTQLKTALISLEEYRRPLARIDLKVGKFKEDHVCDFCFHNIKVGEVSFTAPDMLSCLSLVYGVDICSSCFYKRTKGRHIERISCKKCESVSVVDIQVNQDSEKWRMNYCAGCYDYGNLWFEVSKEEKLFWRACDDQTDARGRVSKLQSLSSKMLDELLDFYYSTKTIVSITNLNIRSSKNRAFKNNDIANTAGKKNKVSPIAVQVYLLD